MCGICAFICQHADESYDLETKLLSNTSVLNHRGPDTHSYQLCNFGNESQALFYGTVLHFRGRLTSQPLECTENGNILPWDGEIFGGIEVNFEENDGEILLERLSACRSDQDILSTFSRIQGPWAAIFWQSASNKLWFGRDVFGRRSLLVNVSPDGETLGLSSVQLKQFGSWKEVPACGLYCLTFDKSDDTGNLRFSELTLFPWVHPEPSRTTRVVSLSEATLFNEMMTFDAFDTLKGVKTKVGDFGLECHVPILNSAIPEVTEMQQRRETSGVENELLRLASAEQMRLAEELVRVLGEAVRVRVECQSHYCSRCITAFLETVESKTIGSETMESRAIGSESVESKTIDSRTIGSETIDSKTTESRTIGSESVDSKTIESRTIGSLNAPGVCIKVHSSICHHTKVAVLFSGGVDSLVIAAIADNFVPSSEPIDLLNVAFEQQHNKLKTSDVDRFGVPDRITGKQGLNELQTISPRRKWNFVEINVSLEELQVARADRIRDLVYPLNTVLDDSIGCAVWFAARGQGVTHDIAGVETSYTSPARVVLVGMGADEQLAGYSRHRVRFNEGGWTGLYDEIRMEIRRISSRNLGRDDRVISDHSREARLPFLDENVVRFLSSLPIHVKADLSLPRGVGEKFLLRVAASQLGLVKGAVLQKRAIQFGSRIAKAENNREKANAVCDRLLSVVAMGAGAQGPG